jgi:hypothetical protein
MEPAIGCVFGQGGGGVTHCHLPFPLKPKQVQVVVP